MRRNSFLTFLKEKSFLIVLTLMLISAGTMAALFSIGREDSTEENQLAQQEAVSEAQPVNETAKKETKTQSEKVTQTTVKKTTDTEEKEKSGTKLPAEQAELEDQYLEAEEMAEASAADVIAEGFSEASVLSLQWPVEGTVLMDFSMDHSVYFETLAQYQYNPAMLIAAEEGSPVVAAAAGTVIEVGKSNEFGYYVTMDAGNGYELTYGQLVDVTTEVGEALEAGDQFASVCFPTRSYSEEGDNLYFKVTQDGTPIDPALLLDINLQ